MSCVADTPSIDLDIGSGGQLTAELIVSPDPSNILEVHANGVFVGGTGIVFPPGLCAHTAAAVAPAGWLIRDGSAVSRTTYAALFAALGTQYGVGDGTTTFNLPDGGGRVDVGKGTNVDVDTLGKSEGLGIAARSPKHNTTVTLSGAPGITDPGHVHPIVDTPAAGNTAAPTTQASGSFNPGRPATIGSAVTGITATIGTLAVTSIGGTRPNDTPAFQVLTPIIKT